MKQKELPWIAEARALVGTKEWPGQKTNPVISGWLRKLGSAWLDDTTPWCLTGDIEVLTDRGFVRLDHIEQVAPRQVAQLNPSTLEVEFTSNYGYIEKDYTGKVYDVQAGTLNFTCDPKHKLFGAFSGTGKYKLREIETLTKFGVKIPKIKSSQKGHPCTDADLVFMAAFLSDGWLCSNRVNFKFSKKHKIALIEQFPFLRKTVDTKLYGVSTVPYTNYSFDKSLLKSEYLADYKLLTLDFIKGLSQHQAKVFIDAYGKFDGTQGDGGAFEVFTADKHLQEQLNYIATMAGYKSTPFSVKQVNTRSKIEYLHHVYVSQNKHRCFNKKHLTEREFEGKLYCLTVPSSVMIIRCRNGVIIPIGNCGTFVAHCLSFADRAVPVHWYRARAYLDYGTRLRKPAYGCLAVKSRVGGGHVFFVVGELEDGSLVGLGGNQGDAVTYARFSRDSIDGYIWPAWGNGVPSMPSPERYVLPQYGQTVKEPPSEA